MVELSYLLVTALIILQVYICACTYWLVKKIDRYENIALSIIERYLSRGNYVRSEHSGAPVYTEITSTAGTVETSLAVCGVDYNISQEILSSRQFVNDYIQSSLSYMPTRVSDGVRKMTGTWYGQLSIDLISLCLHHKNSIKNEYEQT